MLTWKAVHDILFSKKRQEMEQHVQYGSIYMLWKREREKCLEGYIKILIWLYLWMVTFYFNFLKISFVCFWIVWFSFKTMGVNHFPQIMEFFLKGSTGTRKSLPLESNKRTSKEGGILSFHSVCVHTSWFYTIFMCYFLGLNGLGHPWIWE